MTTTGQLVDVKIPPRNKFIDRTQLGQADQAFGLGYSFLKKTKKRQKRTKRAFKVSTKKQEKLINKYCEKSF